MHATLSYLSYRLLTLRIARDTLIISRSLDANRANRQPNHQKPKSAHQLERKQARTLATAVKLYEALISSFEALRELDVVEADADLAQEIEARLEVTQARRCLHTAQSYALLKLWSEALVANEHASLALRSAGSALSVLSQNEESAMGDLQRPIKVQDLTKLAEEVSKQKQQIHKRAFKADEKEDKVAGQQPKIFDIAFNYVTSFDMDGLVAKSQGVEPGPKHVEEKKIAPLAASEKQQQQEEDAPAAKKGGFWGLFSRS